MKNNKNWFRYATPKTIHRSNFQSS